MRWPALIALGAAACGDDLVRDEVFTATGGTRLALQWYGYADGTRQPEAGELYDTVLHARCTPQRWIDGAVRCVPVADDAVYVDAACSALVGRGRTIEEPTHFIAYDRVGRNGRPARVFAAGDETAAVGEFYHRQEGECLGPFPSPPGIAYFAVGGEIFDLVALRDGELGGGRLGLGLRESDDGVRVPLGLRDRELDVACTAVVGAGGRVACEPAGAVTADHFRDPTCRDPVVLVGGDAPVPAVARVVEDSGCPRYHAVGGEVTATLYRRDGDACRPAAVMPAPRIFAAGAALELPVLARTLEEAGGRRLRRIILDDGELRFFDDRLFDTAMRAECRRHAFGDVTRCIPADTAAATTLFTAGCVIAVPVAELAIRACARPAFAAATTDAGLALHAIGDRVAGPLFRLEGGQCRAYTSPPDHVLHTLGPPIDPTAFMGAVYFGER